MLHAEAFSRQGGVDEKKGAPHLEENCNVARYLLPGISETGQLFYDLCVEIQVNRLISGLDLLPDVMVKLITITMENNKEKQSVNKLSVQAVKKIDVSSV